jgi:hypothetical protein
MYTDIDREMTKPLAIELLSEAIDILSPIPDDRWITKEYTDKHSKCDVDGHYMRHKNGKPDAYNVSNCVPRTPIIQLNRAIRFAGFKITVAKANDDPTVLPYETPKERVLALLTEAFRKLK